MNTMSKLTYSFSSYEHFSENVLAHIEPILSQKLSEIEFDSHDCNVLIWYSCNKKEIYVSACQIIDKTLCEMFEFNSFFDNDKKQYITDITPKIETSIKYFENENATTVEQRNEAYHKFREYLENSYEEQLKTVKIELELFENMIPDSYEVDGESIFDLCFKDEVIEKLEKLKNKVQLRIEELKKAWK